MKLEAWLWRVIFLLTAVVLTIAVYRLGRQAFTGLFSAQLIKPPFEADYPEFSVAEADIGDSLVSLFISLDATTIADSEKPANPDQLFLEFVPEGLSPIVSVNEDRINGYPFLQAFVPKGVSGDLKLIHRVDEQDFVVKTDKISVSVAEIPDSVKGSALVPDSASPSQGAQSPLLGAQRVQLWQWFALAILILLGSVYVGIRIAIWKRF